MEYPSFKDTLYILPVVVEIGPLVLKVALGVCFTLNSWKEYILLLTYLITSGKDVIFLLISKFKTNKYLSYLSVNRIPN